MARLISRRAALAALGAMAASGVVGISHAIRSIFDSPGVCLANGHGGMMNVGPADMRIYLDMFMRHIQINRIVEEISGGVRTTTESNSPDVAAQLQAHVSSMYSRWGQESEVTCMSQSLPTSNPFL